MNGNNEQTRSKAQYFFTHYFLAIYIRIVLSVQKPQFLPQNCGFLRRKPMVSSYVPIRKPMVSSHVPIRKPMVSTAETDGFHGGTQWFPRRNPVVSTSETDGFFWESSRKPS